jgi:hypothetical protein
LKPPFSLFPSAALLLAAAASAQPLQWHGEVAMASELSDRGLLVGPLRPAAQAQLSAWIGPDWTALVHVASQKDSQRVLARLAYTQAFSNDWQGELGLSAYRYSGLLSDVLNHLELGAGLTFRDMWSVTLSSQRYGQAPGRSAPKPVWALDTGLRWPLDAHWSLNASLGMAELPYDRGLRYRYGSLGMGWSRDGWRVGLDRVGTDATARRLLAPSARSRWSAVVAREF